MPKSPAQLGERGLFAELEASIYLNHAAVSPPPRRVREAALAMIDQLARRGHAAVPEAAAQRQRLKRRLSQLVGGEPGDFALTPSTTWGLTSLAHNLPWRAGDRVVLFEGEFPANVTPWQRAARQFGLDVRWVRARRFAEDPARGLADLEQAVAGGVRLCAVSFVQFRDGLRMPLSQIAERVHAAGGELCVDAIQGVGVVPLDVREAGIDYLACGAHKWLLALEGAGFVYVRPGLAERFEPRLAGWMSHTDPLDFLLQGETVLRYDKGFARGPEVLEGCSANGVGFAALEASVELIQELGVQQVYEHVQRYHDALEPPLAALGLRSLRPKAPQQRSGTLSFELDEPGGVGRLAAALREQGISCSTPNGALRFSPHLGNPLDEPPRVVEAVERALAATC